MTKSARSDEKDFYIQLTFNLQTRKGPELVADAGMKCVVMEQMEQWTEVTSSMIIIMIIMINMIIVIVIIIIIVNLYMMTTNSQMSWLCNPFQSVAQMCRHGKEILFNPMQELSRALGGK